jgi:hypothetical protein
MQLGAAISLTAHALGIGWLTLHPEAEVSRTDDASSIEMTIWTPPADAPAHSSQPPVSPPVPPPIDEAAPRRTGKGREKIAATPAPAALQASRPAPMASLPTASSPPDLSPATVAASVRNSLAPADAGACQLGTRREPAPECAKDADAAEAPGAQLERELAALASRAPRADPAHHALHRQPDGSYHYEDSRFSARIAPDGSVTLQDRPLVQSALPIPIGGTFDLNDIIEKHVLGKTLHTPQKRRFLEDTAELRAQLADRDRARNFAVGRVRLLAELERIISDPTASPGRKRASVFELWDGCASDEDGALGQLVIEAFIRDRMPHDGVLGYRDVELTALNVRRASSRRFDPYVQESPAGAGGNAG